MDDGVMAVLFFLVISTTAFLLVQRSFDSASKRKKRLPQDPESLRGRPILPEPWLEALNSTNPRVNDEASTEMSGLLMSAGYRRPSALAEFRSLRTGLVILGLPVLREAKANEDALAKNKLLADVVKAYGKPSIVFLPSPLDPAEGAQAFKSYDRIAGSLVQMRASDGVHFTQAGYDYLTQSLLSAILAVMQQKGWMPAGPCP